MSSSTLASRPSGPWYGPLSMTRCPDCTRIVPLKRLVTNKEENDNYGREFVKCESKPEVGKILKKCGHFEWMDAYIERLQIEGTIDLRGGGTRELNLSSPVENLGSESVASIVGDAELKGELKNLNKHLRQMIDLKK